MENNMVMVKSASDFTLVVNIPDIPLHRTWKKRGAQFPIDRKTLLQARKEKPCASPRLLSYSPMQPSLKMFRHR